MSPIFENRLITAFVLVAGFVVGGFLQAKGLPIPAYLATVVGMIGTAFCASLTKSDPPASPPRSSTPPSQAKDTMRPPAKLMIAVALLVSLAGCGLLTRRNVNYVLDEACVILNADMSDDARNRLCGVPKDKEAKAHEIALSARAYAAKHVDAGAE